MRKLTEGDLSKADVQSNGGWPDRRLPASSERIAMNHNFRMLGAAALIFGGAIGASAAPARIGPR
jgi:hypothetical protein